MQEYAADIIRIEHIALESYLISIECPGIATTIKPGQFVQVRAGDTTAPFLRRSFSICEVDVDKGYVTLLVNVVGPGTKMLCHMKRGYTVSVIGPLGHGFDMERASTGSIVLVAGGTGAAPLIFLANTLGERKTGTSTFIIGGKTADAVKSAELCLDTSVTILEATEDGSRGYHGFVTGLLEKKMPEIKPSMIFTCGPHPMMKAVAEIAESHSLPCQVSLEERMACGIGACLGCAVEMKNGKMLRSCVDGPVFNAEEIVL